MISPGIIGAASLASVISGVPFEHDENTLWWNFTNALNTVEPTGNDTIAYVLERVAGVSNLVQSTKDLQPLVSANGANFNKDTGRQLAVETVTGITNGKSGWYLACNVNCATGDSNILSIARPASSAASRGQVYITSSRNFALKAASNDGATTAFVGYSSALTLGIWYTLEMQFRVVAGVGELTIWINGVQHGDVLNDDGVTTTTGSVALAVDNNPAFIDFPASNPSEIVVGNLSSTDIDSLDGELQHLVFYNGIPTSTARDSIRAYLAGERP